MTARLSVAAGESVTMKLAGGKAFTVVARNLSRENKYVKAVTLNGKPLDGFTIRHEDILKGGELVFDMESAPGEE